MLVSIVVVVFCVVGLLFIANLVDDFLDDFWR